MKIVTGEELCQLARNRTRVEIPRIVSTSSPGKRSANQSLVEGDEGGIVPVSEWSPAGNDVTIRVVTNGLELPYPVNQLQVSHMLTLV